MATRPGATPAPPGRRAGASARAQQPITGFFKTATAAEAAEQAAARMEAIAFITGWQLELGGKEWSWCWCAEASENAMRERRGRDTGCWCWLLVLEPSLV
jgi:hypothetical protein